MGSVLLWLKFQRPNIFGGSVVVRGPQSIFTVWENEGWIRKNTQATRLCFSDSRCFGEMKNQKIKKIYGGPKKLSSFKNAGKLAFSQPSFNAATSLCTKKFIISKLQSLKFRIKVILYKSSKKWGRREQLELKVSYFLLKIMENSGLKISLKKYPFS